MSFFIPKIAHLMR